MGELCRVEADRDDIPGGAMLASEPGYAGQGGPVIVGILSSLSRCCGQ